MNEFPVRYLYEAYKILESKGHGAFRNYVNRVDMPSVDIDRVTTKYNFNHDPEFRAMVMDKLKPLKQKLGIDVAKFMRERKHA